MQRGEYPDRRVQSGKDVLKGDIDRPAIAGFTGDADQAADGCDKVAARQVRASTAAAMALTRALVSSLRGGQYYYQEREGPSSPPGPDTATGPVRTVTRTGMAAGCPLPAGRELIIEERSAARASWGRSRQGPRPGAGRA